MLVIVTVSDWEEIKQWRWDRSKSIGRSAKYPGAVYFAMGLFVVGGLAGCFLVSLVDIVQVRGWSWLVAVVTTVLILTWFRKRATVRRVKGQVVRLIEHPGDYEVGPYYEATIDYRVDGQEFQVKVGAASPPGRQGDVIPIFFFPDHPERGRVIGYRHEFPWLLFVVVSVAIIVALVIFAPR